MSCCDYIEEKFPDESTCDDCGGPMRINSSNAAVRWLGRDVVHADPRVCIEELKGRLKRAERRAIAHG